MAIRGHFTHGRTRVAIKETLALRARRNVGCLGGDLSADDIRAFVDHDFSIESCTEEKLQNHAYLSGLAAVVFTQNPEKPLQIVRLLEDHAKLLLDFDCRIFVRLANNARSIVINCIDRLELPPAALFPDEQAKLGNWMPKEQKGGGDALLPHVYICSVKLPVIAKLIIGSPTGHAPNADLNIDIENAKNGKLTRELDSSEILLLQRAFWDCSKIHLLPMTDGLSEESVFRAYVEPLRPQYGPSLPLPFLVKIGSRNNILIEYKNYEESVRSYIPFHLGPRLDLDRCCLGANKGVIVGDFVEESESLRDCARDGRAAYAIAGLFNRTLRGWHFNSKADESCSLADQLLEIFPNEIPTHRLLRAKKLGALLEIEDLRKLFERCNLKPVRIGLIHGDLHAMNVLVRAADAIVIDFFKHDKKPLVYDAACLEAGLLIDSFTKDTKDKIDEKDILAWLQSIEQLYDFSKYTAQMYCHPKDSSYWFYTCVHQIRLYAIRMECHKGQYAAALALALLKKASKDLSFSDSMEYCRAGAYVLAERILVSTFGLTSASMALSVKVL